MSDAAPRPRLALAALGAFALLGVALAAVLSSRGKSWGTIRYCAACGRPDQPLAEGWVEVPAGDSWGVELEPGLGAVIRGPARFEVPGPRPGHWVLALSRGTLYAQAGGAGRVIVLLPRNEAAGVEGATASTEGPGLLEADVAKEGNRVRAEAGTVQLLVRSGERKLGGGQAWASPESAGAPPEPTAQERGWLEALARPAAR